MAWRWAERLFGRAAAQPPALDWIQVEITTRCNARCLYCPRADRSRDRPGRDMSPEYFRALLAQLGRTRHIHLQGWGEPLLHLDFFDMLGWCKAEGLAASTTTNGVLLDEDAARRLVELELDVLGVSLAGVRPEVNDAIRVGAGMEPLVRAMERLAGLKARLGRTRPSVHLAYLSLADGPEDLARLPELARRLGADKIMISEPHPAVTPEMPGLGAGSGRPERAEAAYGEVAARCRDMGLEVFWAARLREITGRACTENPVAACVAGVGGEVSPCAFTTPAIAGAGVRPMVFGNLGRSTLAEIWNAPEYALFRSLFEGPAGADWPAACRACPLRGA